MQHLLEDMDGIKASTLVVRGRSQVTLCLQRISRVMKTMGVRDPEDMSNLLHKSHLLVGTAMIRILLRVPVEGTGAAGVAIQHGSVGQASA
jgi:hypothetical protein